MELESTGMDLLTLPHFYILLCFMLWALVVRILSGVVFDAVFWMSWTVASVVATVFLAVGMGGGPNMVLMGFAIAATVMLSQSRKGPFYPLLASSVFGVVLWTLLERGEVPLFPTVYRALATLFAASIVRAFLDDLGSGFQRARAVFLLLGATGGGVIAWIPSWSKYSSPLLLVAFLLLGKHLGEVFRAGKSGFEKATTEFTG